MKIEVDTTTFVQIIPANPGFLAVEPCWGDGKIVDLERLAVIAWAVTEKGDIYAVTQHRGVCTDHDYRGIQRPDGLIESIHGNVHSDDASLLRELNGEE